MQNFINEIAKVNKIDRFNAIKKVLDENGIEYEIQSIPGRNTTGNIIVKSKPFPKKKVVVCAHYDNADGTPGANDNAAACSILLNLVLNDKDANYKNFVEYVFFDLEEHGFAGSNYYAELNKNDISYVVNLDMCGLGENILLSCSAVDNEMKKHIDSLLKKHKVKEVKILPPGDANSFIRKGVPTFFVVNSTNNDLAWFQQYADFKVTRANSYPDFWETMHKPTDTVDTINIPQVEKIFDFVNQLLSCLYFNLLVESIIVWVDTPPTD